jgi:hypothetical protein
MPSELESLKTKLRELENTKLLGPSDVEVLALKHGLRQKIRQLEHECSPKPLTAADSEIAA